MSDVENITNKAEELIINFYGNITRLKLLLIEIDDINERTIEEMCLPACVLSSMPRYTSGLNYSPTERIALNYEKNATAYKAAAIKLSKDIRRVEVLLANLTDYERFILEKRYFEKNIYGNQNSWRDIAELYSKQFSGAYIDKQTVRKFKNEILAKLNKIMVELEALKA